MAATVIDFPVHQRFQDVEDELILQINQCLVAGASSLDDLHALLTHYVAQGVDFQVLVKALTLMLIEIMMDVDGAV